MDSKNECQLQKEFLLLLFCHLSDRQSHLTDTWSSNTNSPDCFTASTPLQCFIIQKRDFRGHAWESLESQSKSTVRWAPHFTEFTPKLRLSNAGKLGLFSALLARRSGQLWHISPHSTEGETHGPCQRRRRPAKPDCVWTVFFFANSAFPLIYESTDLSQMWLWICVCTHASNANTFV